VSVVAMARGHLLLNTSTASYKSRKECKAAEKAYDANEEGCYIMEAKLGTGTLLFFYGYYD
jgi:hypothetical protein